MESSQVVLWTILSLREQLNAYIVHYYYYQYYYIHYVI